MLGVVLAFIAVRCDSRRPGAAAPPGPVATLATGVVRHDVRFPCGDSQCAAWLYLPAGDAKVPGVVMGHGFAGTRDAGLPFVAEHFAAQGLGVMAIDYRHFGASGGEPRQIVDVWRQLDDWRAALAYIRTHPRIDASRLGLWGASMGGGHALIIAAEDAGVRAVVGQAPLVDADVEGEATFYGVFWLLRLLGSAWADFVLSAFGREPLLISAVVPTGEFGMLADDAAHMAFERIKPSATTYRNAIAARSVFLFDEYNPSATFDRIKAPVLLIGSPDDRFAPFSALEHLAATSPIVTLERNDGDHFDVYAPPRAEHAATVAAQFLQAHLR